MFVCVYVCYFFYDKTPELIEMVINATFMQTYFTPKKLTFVQDAVLKILIYLIRIHI